MLPANPYLIGGGALGGELQTMLNMDHINKPKQPSQHTIDNSHNIPAWAVFIEDRGMMSVASYQREWPPFIVETISFLTEVSGLWSPDPEFIDHVMSNVVYMNHHMWKIVNILEEVNKLDLTIYKNQQVQQIFKQLLENVVLGVVNSQIDKLGNLRYSDVSDWKARPGDIPDLTAEMQHWDVCDCIYDTYNALYCIRDEAATLFRSPFFSPREYSDVFTDDTPLSSIRIPRSYSSPHALR